MPSLPAHGVAGFRVRFGEHDYGGSPTQTSRDSGITGRVAGEDTGHQMGAAELTGSSAICGQCLSPCQSLHKQDVTKLVGSTAERQRVLVGLAVFPQLATHL